jgi:hypothetical protein
MYYIMTRLGYINGFLMFVFVCSCIVFVIISIIKVIVATDSRLDMEEKAMVIVNYWWKRTLIISIISMSLFCLLPSRDEAFEMSRTSSYSHK